MKSESELLRDCERKVRIAESALLAAIYAGEAVGFTPSRVIDEIQERTQELYDEFGEIAPDLFRVNRRAR